MQIENIARLKKLGKRLFEKEYTNTLGIFWTEDSIFLANLKFQYATASIEKLVCLPRWSVEAVDDEVLFLGEIVQKAAQTEGLPYRQSIICLPENKMVSVQKEFPLMKPMELAEAIKWEIEDMLPLSGGMAGYGFQQVEENTAEMLVEIQAMDGAVLESLLLSFRQSDIEVLAIVRQQVVSIVSDKPHCVQLDFPTWSQTLQINDATISPEDLLNANFLPAIQAACYLKRRDDMINILPMAECESNICWLRVYGSVALITIFFMLGIYLQGVFQLRALTKLQEDQTAELALLKKSEEKKDSLVKKQAELENSNHLLENLSRQRIYGQSILVHLGLLPMGKGRLTEVEVKDEHGFVVAGDAPDYMELSKFMRNMEEVEDFKKVQLIDSEKKITDTQDAGLHFVLQVYFAAKEQDNDAE